MLCVRYLYRVHYEIVHAHRQKFLEFLIQVREQVYDFERRDFFCKNYPFEGHRRFTVVKIWFRILGVEIIQIV
jgi:hypothetical protein